MTMLGVLVLHFPNKLASVLERWGLDESLTRLGVSALTAPINTPFLADALFGLHRHGPSAVLPSAVSGYVLPQSGPVTVQPPV